MADHQGGAVWVLGQQLPGQVQRNHTGRAAHAAQAVVDRAAAHLEVVHDHGTQAGCGIEQAAVGDHKVDVLGVDPGLVKQLLAGGEAGGAKLKARGLNASLALIARLDGWADSSFIAEAGAVRNLLLEVNVSWGELVGLLAQLPEFAPWEAPAAAENGVQQACSSEGQLSYLEGHGRDKPAQCQAYVLHA